MYARRQVAAGEMEPEENGSEYLFVCENPQVPRDAQHYHRVYQSAKVLSWREPADAARPDPRLRPGQTCAHMHATIHRRLAYG